VSAPETRTPGEGEWRSPRSRRVDQGGRAKGRRRVVSPLLRVRTAETRHQRMDGLDVLSKRPSARPSMRWNSHNGGCGPTECRAAVTPAPAARAPSWAGEERRAGHDSPDQRSGSSSQAHCPRGPRSGPGERRCVRGISVKVGRSWKGRVQGVRARPREPRYSWRTTRAWGVRRLGEQDSESVTGMGRGMATMIPSVSNPAHRARRRGERHSSGRVGVSLLDSRRGRTQRCLSTRERVGGSSR